MSTRLITGDCRMVLPTLPAASVQMVCTSPPYWALRAYLPADHPNKHLEIGSEPTVDDWVRTMVEVFREVRRVLRDDGVLFLNLGDSYAGSRAGGDTGASTLEGGRASQDRIAAGSKEGDTVLDPFGGSGTTGMAADQMQRHAILIDIDEHNEPMARSRVEGDSSLFAEGRSVTRHLCQFSCGATSAVAVKLNARREAGPAAHRQRLPQGRGLRQPPLPRRLRTVVWPARDGPAGHEVRRLRA